MKKSGKKNKRGYQKKGYQKKRAENVGKEIDELLGIENNRTRNILLIIGEVIVLIALLGLLYTLMEYGKSDRIYSRAQKDFVVILPEENVSVAENGKLPQGEAQGENLTGADSGDNEIYLRTTYTGRSIYRYEIFAYEDISAYSSIYDVYGADAMDISGLLRKPYLSRESSICAGGKDI